MRLSIAILAASFCLSAQTSVYVQSSGPASQTVIGATNATPVVLTTNSSHGFSVTCNTSTNICYCGGVGVPTGTGASPVNGVKECVPTDATHLAIYQGPFDSSPGSPLVGNGAWWNGATIYPNIEQSGQWIAPLTKYTIPANPGPLGYFDGTNGDLTRRMSLTTRNGLTALVVTGGSGGSCTSVTCTITVTTSYNPIAGANRFPIAAGNSFSIHGTGTALDTCGAGSADCPYSMATVGTTGWTATGTWTGVSTGTYTNYASTCGPALTPNDTIGGTLSCTTISQIGHANNPWWTNLTAIVTALGWNSGSSYKTVYDGGSFYPGADIHSMYAIAADRFMVDPSNSQWLNIMIYSLNHDYRTSGVGYTVNSLWWGGGGQSNSDYNYSNDFYGLAEEYAIVTRSAPTSYWVASEQAAFLNRNFNDVDDPNVSPATTTNQDAGIQANHNWVLSSGHNLASGTNDATHATLNSSGDCIFGKHSPIGKWRFQCLQRIQLWPCDLMLGGDRYRERRMDWTYASPE